MSALDELQEAARDLAALLKEHYMLPNTWPQSRRFLAAVEALAGQSTAAGADTAGADAGQGTATAAPAAPDALPGPVPAAQDKPERQSRAPLS